MLSAIPDHPAAVSRYDERLAAPVRWWIWGVLFIASLWVAIIVAVPGPIAFLVAAIAIALLAAALLSYGGARVTVDDTHLQAGKARVPRHLVGPATALDAAATHRALGVDADARAYLLTRPYLAQTVRVAINDPADPTPYWLIGTRHPAQLVAALAASADRAGSPAAADSYDDRDVPGAAAGAPAEVVRGVGEEGNADGIGF